MASTGLVIAASHERLLEAFYAGRNQRTLAAYRADLADFRAFVGVPAPEDAARRLLAGTHGDANALALGYRASMVERGLAPATINRRLAALRSLVQLGNTLGLVPWKLTVANMKSQSYRDTRGPGRDAFTAMVAASDARADAKGCRDVALLRLMHDLGLRRGEVVGLDVGDVDVAGKRLRVLGKGRTEAEPITLPERTLEALVFWLAVRGEAPGPLFLNYDRAGKGSGRLSGAAVYHVVTTLGERLGVVARPHGLRHTAITTALDLTKGDVRAVQKFSRHRDMRVLNRYDDNRSDLAGAVARLVAGN